MKNNQFKIGQRVRLVVDGIAAWEAENNWAKIAGMKVGETYDVDEIKGSPAGIVIRLKGFSYWHPSEKFEQINPHP